MGNRPLYNLRVYDWLETCSVDEAGAGAQLRHPEWRRAVARASDSAHPGGRVNDTGTHPSAVALAGAEVAGDPLSVAPGAAAGLPGTTAFG